MQPGANYRARTDFATVLAPEGGLVHYKLVIDPDDGRFRGAGVVLPAELGAVPEVSPWNRRYLLGLSAPFDSTRSVVGENNETSFGADLFFDTYVTYQRDRDLFSGVLELESGFEKVRPEASAATPWRKTHDRLRIDVLYSRFVNARVGPYTRFGLRTSLFESNMLVTEDTPQRDHPHEPAVLVDDVEVEDHLDVARPLERRDRAADRQVLGQREDLGVHDAAGRPVVVLEKLLDLLRFPLAHEVEDARGQLLGQPVDERRRVVRLQLRKEARQLLGRAVAEQPRPDLAVELDDRLHRKAAVVLDQGGEGGPALQGRQLAEDLGQVRRMLLPQDVQQVGGRADALQPLDGIQYDVDSAAVRHVFDSWEWTSSRSRDTRPGHRGGRSSSTPGDGHHREAAVPAWAPWARDVFENHPNTGPPGRAPATEVDVEGEPSGPGRFADADPPETGWARARAGDPGVGRAFVAPFHDRIQSMKACR